MMYIVRVCMFDGAGLRHKDFTVVSLTAAEQFAKKEFTRKDCYEVQLWDGTVNFIDKTKLLKLLN